METKALTYAELGAALGITAASAKRLALRRGWQKSPGNDGKARVAVPIERLEAERPVTGDATGDAPGDAASDAASDITGDATPAITSDMSEAVTVLTRHIERLEADLAAITADRDAERVRAAQVAVLQAVLDVERERAAELRADRDHWRETATAPRGIMAWLRRRA